MTTTRRSLFQTLLAGCAAVLGLKLKPKAEEGGVSMASIREGFHKCDSTAMLMICPDGMYSISGRDGSWRKVSETIKLPERFLD